MVSNITYWHQWPGNFTLQGINETSVSGLGSLFQYTNTVMGGSLGLLILFMIFPISFILMKSFGSNKAFAVSIFVTAFMATLLMTIEVIAVPFVIMLWLGTVIGIILVRNDSNRGL